MRRYHLRENPTPSERRRVYDTYLNDTLLQASISSPRTKRRLNKEAEEAEIRAHGKPGIENLLLANELVSGGLPASWHNARHDHALYNQWEEVMGRQRTKFTIGQEVVPWLGHEVRAIVIQKAFGVVDMQDPIQGRSMTAKRLDGKELGPGSVPSPDEMSWREWRRLSRACNLLLEAVDGVPWGHDMNDEEWEEFSHAEEKFDHDFRRVTSMIEWEAKRIRCDRMDELHQSTKKMKRDDMQFERGGMQHSESYATIGEDGTEVINPSWMLNLDSINT